MCEEKDLKVFYVNPRMVVDFGFSFHERKFKAAFFQVGYVYRINSII